MSSAGDQGTLELEPEDTVPPLAYSLEDDEEEAKMRERINKFFHTMSKEEREQAKHTKSEEGDEHEDAAVKQKKNKKKKAKGGAEGGAPAADGAKRVVNTSVFAQGIPRDATLEEVTAFFKKAGIPRMDEEGGKYRIKMYRDENGAFKGEALCTYLLEPSVAQAKLLLDGAPFRLGGKDIVTVQEAVFTPKAKAKEDAAGGAAALKKRPRSQKAKKFDQKKVLLSWKGDDDTVVSTKPHVVVLRHMFVPEDFSTSPTFRQELKDDITAECEKIGPVDRVTIYDKHTQGIVTVKFKSGDDAEKCVQMMSGRFFSGRRLEAQFQDAQTTPEMLRLQCGMVGGFLTDGIGATGAVGLGAAVEDEDARRDAFMLEHGGLAGDVATGHSTTATVAPALAAPVPPPPPPQQQQAGTRRVEAAVAAAAASLLMRGAPVGVAPALLAAPASPPAAASVASSSPSASARSPSDAVRQRLEAAAREAERMLAAAAAPDNEGTPAGSADTSQPATPPAASPPMHTPPPRPPVPAAPVPSPLTPQSLHAPPPPPVRLSNGSALLGPAAAAGGALAKAALPVLREVATPSAAGDVGYEAKTAGEVNEDEEEDDTADVFDDSAERRRMRRRAAGAREEEPDDEDVEEGAANSSKGSAAADVDMEELERRRDALLDSGTPPLPLRASASP